LAHRKPTQRIALGLPMTRITNTSPDDEQEQIISRSSRARGRKVTSLAPPQNSARLCRQRKSVARFCQESRLGLAIDLCRQLESFAKANEWLFLPWLWGLRRRVHAGFTMYNYLILELRTTPDRPVSVNCRVIQPATVNQSDLPTFLKVEGIVPRRPVA